MNLEREHIQRIGELLTHHNYGDHIQATGIHLESAESGRSVMRMDYHRDIIGNPATGWVSGGALMALLDSVCGFTASTCGGELRMNTTIDLRCDYLRVSEPGLPIYAEARVYRATRHVTFVRAEAYQQPDQPIATAVGTFMHMDNVEQGLQPLLSMLSDEHALPERQPLSPAEPLVTEAAMAAVLQQTKGASDARDLINAIPYTRFLQMSRLLDTSDGSWIFHLPPAQSLIGHPALPAIHGGALAGFMEYAAIIHLILKMDVRRVPKVIDFSIDFIRAGQLRDTFVRCKIIRFGRKLVSLSIDAWQEDNTKLIAKARTQILLE